MTECKAALCTVQATAAVQWVGPRGTRAEPICRGHELAFARLIRDDEARTRIRRARILTMQEYAARLARAGTTATVGVEDLAAAFANLADWQRRR